MQHIEEFYVIGITVRTTNEYGQSAQDIPALWRRFFDECHSARIPNKTGDTVYCAYLDYEFDHTAPYTALIGCKVRSLDDVPEGMTGAILGGGNYLKFKAVGQLEDGMVYDQWLSIWSAGLARRFTNDFEVYTPEVRPSVQAEIDIFVAVTS